MVLLTSKGLVHFMPCSTYAFRREPAYGSAGTEAVCVCVCVGKGEKVKLVNDMKIMLSCRIGLGA
jgi:hypothetical protein